MQRQFVATNMMNSEVAAFLKDMRRFRVRADYQLYLTVSNGNVENIFDRFNAYLNECRQLLEVIT